MIKFKYVFTGYILSRWKNLSYNLYIYYKNLVELYFFKKDKIQIIIFLY